MRTFSRNNNNHWMRVLVLAVFLVGAVWGGAVGAASGNTQNEESGQRVQSSQGRIPLSYDGFGVIDRIERGRLIINDSVMTLSSLVTYHDQEGRYTSSTEFKAGTRVAYQLNKQGEITVLYLFDGQLP